MKVWAIVIYAVVPLKSTSAAQERETQKCLLGLLPIYVHVCVEVKRRQLEISLQIEHMHQKRRSLFSF